MGNKRNDDSLIDPAYRRHHQLIDRLFILFVIAGAIVAGAMSVILGSLDITGIIGWVWNSLF